MAYETHFKTPSQHTRKHSLAHRLHAALAGLDMSSIRKPAIGALLQRGDIRLLTDAGMPESEARERIAETRRERQAELDRYRMGPR